MKLTDDEIRDRFSAYHDGDLPSEEIAFIRQRLDEDKALSEEYERFRRMLGSLGALGLEQDVTPEAQQKPKENEKEEPVDLLSGVQNKLNKRSGGKFYNNRWSRTAGVIPMEFMALIVLLILLVLWLGLTQVTGVRPAQPTPNQTPPTPVRVG